MSGDVIVCGTCHLRLERTPQMVKYGTRHHAGRCAARATAERRWQKGELDAHMAKMRAASTATRHQRLLKRLARLVPDVPPETAAIVYAAGYKAGWSAKRRRNV